MGFFILHFQIYYNIILISMFTPQIMWLWSFPTNLCRYQESNSRPRVAHFQGTYIRMPYQLSYLSRYCYCGESGDWYRKMLQCNRCLQWFHQVWHLFCSSNVTFYFGWNSASPYGSLRTHLLNKKCLLITKALIFDCIFSERSLVIEKMRVALPFWTHLFNSTH